MCNEKPLKCLKQEQSESNLYFKETDRAAVWPGLQGEGQEREWGVPGGTPAVSRPEMTGSGMKEEHGMKRKQ